MNSILLINMESEGRFSGSWICALCSVKWAEGYVRNQLYFWLHQVTFGAFVEFGQEDLQSSSNSNILLFFFWVKYWFVIKVKKENQLPVVEGWTLEEMRANHSSERTDLEVRVPDRTRRTSNTLCSPTLFSKSLFFSY